jgi:hypothetical protein
MEVTAKINISTPAGRKIVRELEKHKKLVKITYPISLGEDGKTEQTYSVEEVFEELDTKLKKHYGVTE